MSQNGIMPDNSENVRLPKLTLSIDKKKTYTYSQHNLSVDEKDVLLLNYLNKKNKRFCENESLSRMMSILTLFKTFTYPYLPYYNNHNVVFNKYLLKLKSKQKILDYK